MITSIQELRDFAQKNERDFSVPKGIHPKEKRVVLEIHSCHNRGVIALIKFQSLQTIGRVQDVKINRSF